MSYRFAIQASNPRSSKTGNAGDRTLEDAMETVFPLEAEYAILIWNWIYVPLTYKYDLSLMVRDIVRVVDSVLSHATGSTTVQWPSNTFAATWRIEWEARSIRIDAEWTCVLGDVEALLCGRPTVVMTPNRFVAEWKRPLEIIAAALSRAGYTEELVGMPDLLAVLNKIEQRGSLYEEDNESPALDTV